MNTKTTILIKVDKKVKAAAQKVAKEIGIPLSTIMGAQMRKFAHEGRIEFEKPLTPTPKAIRWIKEAQKEFEEGETKRFATMEELIADLHK